MLRPFLTALKFREYLASGRKIRPQEVGENARVITQKIL